MKSKSTNRAGITIFLVGFLFHAGFISMGIPPLVLAINSIYMVNANLYPPDGTFVSLSRSKGLLFECLKDPAQKAIITQTSLTFTSIHPHCALYDLNVPMVANRSDNSRTLTGFRMAYAILYVGGLGAGAVALIVSCLGSLACCSLSRHYETKAAFADMVVSIASMNAIGAIAITAGCALYIYEQFLEVYTPTVDFQFSWANLNSNLRGATSVQLSIGTILMWISAGSALLASVFQFAAAYHFKPQLADTSLRRGVQTAEPPSTFDGYPSPLYPVGFTPPERPPRAFMRPPGKY